MSVVQETKPAISTIRSTSDETTASTRPSLIVAEPVALRVMMMLG
jgi:hypothetical protein